MQNVLLHVVKASYPLYITGDMLLAEKGEGCKAILKLLIDSLALLGLSSIEINKEEVNGAPFSTPSQTTCQNCGGRTESTNK